jgi:hypothetical protein
MKVDAKQGKVLAPQTTAAVEQITQDANADKPAKEPPAKPRPIPPHQPIQLEQSTTSYPPSPPICAPTSSLVIHGHG